MGVANGPPNWWMCARPCRQRQLGYSRRASQNRQDSGRSAGSIEGGFPMGVGGIGNCWYTVFVAARFLQDEFDEDEDPRVARVREQGLETWSVRPRATWLDEDVDESKIIVLFGTRLALIGDGGPDAMQVQAEE